MQYTTPKQQPLHQALYGQYEANGNVAIFSLRGHALPLNDPTRFIVGDGGAEEEMELIIGTCPLNGSVSMAIAFTPTVRTKGCSCFAYTPPI